MHQYRLCPRRAAPRLVVEYQAETCIGLDCVRGPGFSGLANAIERADSDLCVRSQIANGDVGGFEFVRLQNPFVLLAGEARSGGREATECPRVAVKPM